jgi:SAM-dependent methyltransferase
MSSEGRFKSCAKVIDLFGPEPVVLADVEVINNIRSGCPVTDADFDRLFPKKMRDLSEVHWTPVSVARRAAALAVRKPDDLILDVGSGAGKFCIIGALTTSGRFYGVEQREDLVGFAGEVVARFRIPRVQSIYKNMVDLDWRPYDAIYLFNPFSENLDDSIRIDDVCPLNSDLYIKYIRQTQEKLAKLDMGTRVVTLNGFGGDLPPTYRLVYEEEMHFLPLQVWEKHFEE